MERSVCAERDFSGWLSLYLVRMPLNMVWITLSLDWTPLRPIGWMHLYSFWLPLSLDWMPLSLDWMPLSLDWMPLRPIGWMNLYLVWLP